MYLTFSQRLVQGASLVHKLLQLDPKIGLDLRQTDIRTIIAVIFCLMTLGIDTAPSITSYLAERGSPFDEDTVEFVLAQYEGEDPSQHLWERDYLGAYSPLDELLTEYQLPVSNFD